MSFPSFARYAPLLHSKKEPPSSLFPEHPNQLHPTQSQPHDFLFLLDHELFRRANHNLLWKPRLTLTSCHHKASSHCPWGFTVPECNPSWWYPTPAGCECVWLRNCRFFLSSVTCCMRDSFLLFKSGNCSFTTGLNWVWLEKLGAGDTAVIKIN